jgi:hypothetical protein
MVWWSWSTGIPLVRAKRWDGFGVGIHKDFAEWSSAGHSCPGLARARQFEVLLNQAWRAVNPTIQTGDDEMADVFALDSNPDKLYIRAADGSVRHVTGFEGAVAQAIDPGWASGKRVIHVASDVEGWLESL